MSTYSESSHAINLSNFKLLIDTITAFGPVYNPSPDPIKIANMTASWTSCSNLHNAFLLGYLNAKQPINEREILFKPLSKIVTRTLGILSSSGASKQVYIDAKGFADKIRGHGLNPRKFPDGSPDPNHISNSHLSFVMRADTFAQLVLLYKNETKYNPNETDLKTASLQTYSDSLLTANEELSEIIAPVNQSRIDRNHALYDEFTGLIDIAYDCKDYVKAIFGSGSPEYLAVLAIKFTRYRK
jgi:hypothetical protein